ncbi:hypothetical protein O4215_20690 [Rhodococcus maanshanensis]|uniref:hypothetical protein n=1 Tax=Rhodococcus maanshanensis TaxID=183556 RepID=UPI0022B3A50B|nr:hypothetical protein [Rhodococcus maanshanensis]MCZ4557983.1 hypothetical protein [Rhodococcus maanshanensis]
MAIRWDDSIADKVEAATEAAVLEAGMALLAHSDADVPLEEGTLMNSGNVDADGADVTVFYDTPYAAEQHENLDLNHGGGRKAKYLEDATTAFGAEFLEIAAGPLREALS